MGCYDNVDSPMSLFPEPSSGRDDRCFGSLGHREKHLCSCRCALDGGHPGRHRCEVDVSHFGSTGDPK